MSIRENIYRPMYGLAYKLTFLSEQVARISLRKSSFSFLTERIFRKPLRETPYTSVNWRFLNNFFINERPLTRLSNLHLKLKSARKKIQTKYTVAEPNNTCLLWGFNREQISLTNVSAVGWPQNAENCDNIVNISLPQFGK